jgi:hypothetical protein
MESLLDLFVHVDDFSQAWLPPGCEGLIPPGQLLSIFIYGLDV